MQIKVMYYVYNSEIESMSMYKFEIRWLSDLGFLNDKESMFGGVTFEDDLVKMRIVMFEDILGHVWS